MQCSGCGAHLIDGTKKCPFCKEILYGNVSTNSDVTYTLESNEQYELIKNSSRVNISDGKLKNRRNKKRKKRLLGYAILLAIAVVFISIIVGIISLFIYAFSDKTVYTSAYYTENEIGIRYKNDTVVLTNEAYNSDSKTKKDSSVGMGGLVSKSVNGKVTAFLDKFDVSKNQGRLKIMIKANPENIITVAENVSPGFKISDDGKHIVFIKNANSKGNMGELWSYEIKKKALKVADKVDADKVLLSRNQDRIVYIKNYNYKSRVGTAYYAEFGDYAENKIVSDVHMIYGTADDSDIIIYSKEYNKDKQTYAVFAYKDEEVALARNCGIAPRICQNGKYAFICGDKADDRYSLYRVNLGKLKPEKIINNMSAVNRIDEDGKRIIYSKLFDNNVADYYIWTEGETELKIADGVNYTKRNQVAVSKDFKKVAYIANYVEEKNGGSLYHCEYSVDSVTVPEKISDDVYGCYVLNDKQIVYTKNYSSKSKNAGLFAFENSEIEINSEINPKFLTVDKDIICMYDYSTENGGNLYRIDNKLSEQKITEDVFEYYRKENGELVLVKSRNNKTAKFDLYETSDGDVELIKKDAEKVLFY